MSLIKEKERLIKIASNFNKETSFESIDKEIPSYYIPYEESKHVGSVLEYYNSEELLELKLHLEGLWGDDENLRCMIPIILSGYRKCRTNGVNYLREMEIYNYMM